MNARQTSLFDSDPTGSPSDSPAKTYRWLGDVLDWAESEAACSSDALTSLLLAVPAGFASRTSPACFPGAAVRSVASWPNDSKNMPSESAKQTRWQEVASATNAKSGANYIKHIRAAISQSSSPSWSNWGMASPGVCLTLSGSEFPSGAVACSLSDVLETSDVPAKYFLSPTACRGILRRAEKRGRELPEALHRALSQAANATTLETKAS